MDRVLALDAVTLRRDGLPVLSGVTWSVGRGERWVVLGPNGSGKTTLLQIAGARLHPSSGAVEILGARLGAADWRAVRERVGFVSGSVVRTLRPALTAAEIVMTGRYGALEPWWHTYTEADRARAAGLLDAVGASDVAGRAFGVISEGERQLVLLARVLMADPGLLLLDEPFAGLDLGNRERLLDRIAALVADPGQPPLVLVTHHVEEIPPGITHALLLRAGAVVGQGPIAETLTADALSTTFGIEVEVEARNGRWSAHAV